MQDLPRRNRLTRRRRNPSILVGELAGQHLVLRVLADKRNISGGRLSLNRVSGDLDDVQEPARKDVGLLLSHVLPRWCVVPVTHGLSLRLHTDPGSANLGRSADGCSPDLNVSLFGQLHSTMTLKS